MSSATPTPVPPPAPATTPNWAAIIAYLIVTAMSAWNAHALIVTPPAPVPVVVPPVIPIVLPPQPAPAGITPTVTDSKGLPLVSPAIGQQFIVSVAAPITLTAVLAAPTDADVFKTSPQQLVITLRPGATQLQIVCAGSGEPTIFIIKPAAVAPPPTPLPVPVPVVVPPTPVPVPSPSPVPAPVVNKGPMHISIVEDAANRSVAVNAVTDNYNLWQKYRKAGHTVHLWNGGATSSPEQAAQADIAAVRAATLPLPAIVVRDSQGVVQSVTKLPVSLANTPTANATAAAAVDSLLSPYTGVL